MANMAMIGLTTGGVLNIALDPLLIFVFKLGISGAGIATMISQYISMAILLSVFLLKRPQSRIKLKYFTFESKVFWKIISTGLPSFARQGLSSCSTMMLNLAASGYGDACIAAMSIVSKCSGLIFSVCVGIGQGFQPVSAFNYGSKKYDRVRKAISFLWIFGTIVLAMLSAFMFAFAPYVVQFFRKDAEVIAVGVPALRYMCLAMIFMPTVMTANMTFQSVGKSVRAFFLACCQNGLIFIPVLLVLSKIMGVTGIEISQPVAYVTSAVISVPFLLTFLRQLKSTQNKKII